MVQISKLTKDELAITGFKNRSIASRFMKQILNKKGRDFKDKVELINALTSKYFEMKNYGIDLNDIAKIERTGKKAEKIVKKSQEEYNKLLEREDLQQIVSDLEVENYLIEINYKLPENKNYTDVKKKLKNKFYYEWKGIEDIVQTITDLYRQQDTAFKFNISLGYILTNLISH
jgi:anaerobic ribonucleoside-triphosphate reductase